MPTSQIEARSQRRKRRELLGVAGWDQIDEENEKQELYGRFVGLRGFSIKSEDMINIPTGSLVYDYRKTKFLSEENQQAVERSFRKLIFDFFCKRFAEMKCVVVDVNHPNYFFVPSKVKLDALFEPWPCPLTQWAEYINFSDADFTQGLFTNPKRMQVVIYGKELVESALSDLPMIPVEVRCDVQPDHP